MAIEDLIAANAAAALTTATTITILLSGLVARRIYDMERAGRWRRTLGSELEGFGEQRDLVAQRLRTCEKRALVLRNSSVRTWRLSVEGFLGEQDERRSEQEKAEAQQREQRLTD